MPCPLDPESHRCGAAPLFSFGPCCNQIFHWEEKDGFLLGVYITSTSLGKAEGKCLIWCKACNSVVTSGVHLTKQFWTPGVLWGEISGNSALSNAYCHRAVCKYPPAAPVARKDECPVCMERPRDVVLVECGHRVCEVCGDKISLCPLCKAPIARRIKLFD